MKLLISCALVALVLFSAASCERQFPTTPGIVFDEYYPLIQTANAWTIPANPRPGTVVTLEMIFNSYSPIKEINLLQVINRTASGITTRDTTRAATFMYQRAYSQLKGGDTLLMNYTIPAITRPAGTTVSLILIGEIITQSGLRKQRATSAVTLPAP
ncbi:MAG: hypothetical protein RML40_08720 [Bacteroidota bacterium]|nr:hypothetical protein [Candidatus Kapabacteria bacterium]MDW8220599.1 hypothetical protein [Bacteroidota bacterium]